MAYQELKKIYYKDQSSYVPTYQERFQSEDAVHLDFDIAGYPAFFLETKEVLRLAVDILKKDKVVAQLSEELPGVAKSQYQKKCLIDEIVLTNKIEGVHSSRKEIGEALDVLEQQSRDKHKHARFAGLVNKYLKLMSGEMIPIKTCSDIRDIYDEVFLQEVIAEDPKNEPDGEIFRKGPESVYSTTGKEIHKGVYPEKKIVEYMDKALDFLHHGDTDSLYRICIFHYMFEYIHPFYDGNGRMGRLILSYCISKEVEPLLAYRISGTIKENLNVYYHAFQECNDHLNRGDLTPFLLMQLQMILAAMCTLEESLRTRLVRLNRYSEQMIRLLPNADNDKTCQLYYLLVQAALFSESGIPTFGLKELLEIKSPTTLKKHLAQIPEELMITKVKDRIKYYEVDLKKIDDLMFEEEMNRGTKG